MTKYLEGFLKIECFPVISGVLLSVTKPEGAQVMQRSVLYVGCWAEDQESMIKIQQTEVTQSCQLYADVCGLVHCHLVNDDGNSVLILQDFC